eukprot:768617-Hanusia_phi.AAC.2
MVRLAAVWLRLLAGLAACGSLGSAAFLQPTCRHISSMTATLDVPSSSSFLARPVRFRRSPGPSTKQTTVMSSAIHRRMFLSSAASVVSSFLVSPPAGSSAASVESSEFYVKWPYAQPSDILPFIFSQASQGNVDEILAAMDEFGRYYPMYKLGAEKGKIMEQEIRARGLSIKSSLEVGTFFGYSAMRTARNLAGGGHLYCIEYNPAHADVASQLVRYAGLQDVITIFVGLSGEVLPKVAKHVKHADFVFLDHNKSLYLPDLKRMQELGIVGKGTVVAADNVIYPGTPDFLDYVKSGPAWETQLVEANFEYDLMWKQGWSPKKDAISFSTCLL